MSSSPMFQITPEPGEARATALDQDAIWYCEAGAPVPSALSQAFAIACPERFPVEARVACLAPATVDGLAGQVKRMRAGIGDTPYLILIFPGEALPPRATAALDFGADDVVAEGDVEALRLALKRADRQLLRLRREAALARGVEIERDFLQACLDNIPTPIFFKNSRGIYVGCNRAFENYLGLSAAEIIGNSVYEVAPRECAEIYAVADAELLDRGGEQSYETRVPYADGSIRDVAFRKAVIVDEDGQTRGLAGAMIDITERKRLETELADAAARDPLTNSFNRRHFFRHVEDLLKTGDIAAATVAVVDIDHFKAINDGFGHAAGDAVLRAIARLLELRLGLGIVARAGGEEFFVYLPGMPLAAASAMMEDLRREIAALVVEDGGSRMSVTASIGLAEHAPARESFWDCIRRADAALYQAKNGGRNRLALAA